MFGFPQKKLLNASVNGMRVSLGIIFLWFGMLKLFGSSPVYEIVNASFPFFTTGVGNYVLAIFESLIGAGLIFNFLPSIIAPALIAHLLGTLSVFIVAPEIMFEPSFPVLNLNGEFIIKNIALAMGGLIVLWGNPKYFKETN